MSWREPEWPDRDMEAGGREEREGREGGEGGKRGREEREEREGREGGKRGREGGREERRMREREKYRFMVTAASVRSENGAFF